MQNVEYISHGGKTNSDIRLLSKIHGINYSGDYISPPLPFYDAQRIIHKLVEDANANLHFKSTHFYKVVVNKEFTSLDVLKVTDGMDRGTKLCTVKKIHT